jgi:uncharacterized membrane protein HdeD (DUF308 family)
MPNEQLAKPGRNWGWVLVAGVAYITLGIIALSWPVASTVGLTFTLGILFLVASVVQAAHAIHLRKESGTGSRVVQSIAALVAGLLILRYPGAGMVGIAIAMTFYFFVSAFSKWAIAAGMRPHSGWGWTFVSATCSFLLGAYMIVTFPVSALWVPGLILGIDLVIMGASMIGFAFSVRSARARLKETIVEAPRIDRPAA